MSASTATRVHGQGETNVCPPMGPAVEVIDVGGDVRKEAERDAEHLLTITANVGGSVEPAGIAERLGVRVREGKLKDEIYGGLLIEPGEDPKILVNREHGLVRQRLTCASEIGRYMRQSPEVARYVHIDRAGVSSGAHEDPEETYADEFGACLLMPRMVVQALVEIGMDDLQMALYFVVSREAMQLRLTSLGFRAANRSAV